MSGILKKYYFVNNFDVWNTFFYSKKNLLVYNKFFIFLFMLNNFSKLKCFYTKKNDFVISFLKHKKLSLLLAVLFKNFWRKLLHMYCGYAYSRIFIKLGLGFRKKYKVKINTFFMNIGRRKWVSFKLAPSSYFFNLRKRNLFLFVSTKRKLYYYLTHFKTLRRETLFKFKGIMTLNRIIIERKISRSILFARRVKFKSIKLKLTKKQNQRK